jgi:menaquinone-dependent protoporphyrinogen IX oxidase
MKKVLVLYYSQTGQLSSVAKSLTAPLEADEKVQVIYQNIEPKKAYPFPWSLIEFFDIFPESVYMDGCDINDFKNVEEKEEFDLVILAYTIWFLSPSLPISGFLNSKYAKLVNNKPVITLIACRNMWVMAQEKMKVKLNELNATLIDNVVLTDQGGNFATFITTPRWMLTGRKNAFWGLPKAGVSPKEITNASRFGKALSVALSQNLEKEKQPLLQGLEAVKVDNRLIGSEKIATKSFKIWGGLIRKVGGAGDKKRIPVLLFYLLFLLAMIVIVVPINTLIKPIFRKFNHKKVEEERIYFEGPSGSSSERLKEYSSE